MANERQTDLILRAQVDQALQPLSQVTQRVKDLVTVLNQQRDAAKTGDTTLGEYAKALRDVEKASGDLLKQRAALDNFATRGQAVGKRQDVVDQRLQRRDEFAASLPPIGERTDKDVAALAKLDRALTSSQNRLDTTAIAYQRAVDQLQRLGVLTDALAANQQRLRLDQAHATVSDAVLYATQALREGQAVNDTLVATLKLAGVEKQVAAQRARDTERFLADQAREQRAVIDAAEVVRATGRAAQAHVDTSSFTGAVRSGRGISREDIEAAFAASDAEKALADQRAKDTARFLADQEKERQAVHDAAEEIRAKGRAAQAHVDQQSSLNARRFDFEQAVAEEAQAKQRAKDADAFQAQQARLAAAVTSVWEDEDAAAAKARARFDDFRAAVEKAIGQAQAARASAAAGAGALGQPAASPAPTLVGQVREALAGGPGAGTGIGDLTALQAEVARVSEAVSKGGGAVGAYTQELKNLDAVSREVVRQSQIVDSFQKQQKAARDALIAVRDAATELQRLEGVARGATTDDQVSEVTSAIAAQRRKLGSVDEGRGLLGDARAQQEALAVELAALQSIGVGADHVAEAMLRLTQVAVATSTARQEIISRERVAFNETADDIIRRAAGLSTAAASGGQPSARSAVAAVAGAGRSGAEIADVAAATDKLDKSVTTATLTAQSFNKVMDEIFAVQRQIAQDATLIDQFNAQKAAVDKATAAYTEAQHELARVGAAAKAGAADLSELKRAETALNGAAGDLQRQATLHAQIDAQLKARRLDTANLTVETDRLVQSSQRLAAVQARTSQGNGTVFGLSQYQITNLGFQVNDVITQLSLGQGVLRTFESQAGQIFQVFETSVTAMKRMALYGAPAAAAIAVLVLSLLRLKETMDVQREFSRLLSANADGLAYQAKGLTSTARVIEGYGVSFADATAAVKTFVHDGLDIQSMTQFAKTAKNLADVTGTTFPEALKAIGAIAHGSYADIVKLNDEYNFLHISELQAIKDSFDEGNSAAGRTIAINAATLAFQKGREHGVDPMAQAVRDLSAAWHEFLDAIGSTRLLTVVAEALRNISKLASETASAIRYAANPTQGEANNKVVLLQGALKNTQDQIDRLTKTRLPGDDAITMMEGRAKDLTRQLEEAVRVRDKMITGVPGAVVPGLPGSPTAPGSPGSEVTSARSVSAIALSHLGENANQVSDFLKPQNLNPLVDAWCAAFANAALREAGISGSGSNIATSFEKWGQAIASSAIQAGDILVQAKGHAAGEVGGHVGIATGQFKTGPNGELLVGMVSGNSGGLVRSTFEDPRELDARRGTPTAPSTFGLPGFRRNPDLANLDASKNLAVLDDIAKRQAADVDELLRGDDRILQDQHRLSEYYKQRNNEIETQLDGAPRSPELIAAFKAEIDKFAQKLETKRKREEDAANNAALQIVRSAQEQADKANKTDPAAQRRAVDAQFEKQLSALNEQIAHGASLIAGESVSAARDALLKVRDQAREAATIAANRAVVDETVKARDLQVQSVENDLHTGAITLQAAFDRIAAIVKAFNPQIATAIGRSNADLLRQPQTPAIQEQLAKNQAVDATGAKAIGGVDQAALSIILGKQRERNDLVASYNQLVRVGAISQDVAEKKITEAYDKTTPQILQASAALQTQLEKQRDLRVISSDTYDKMSAELKKVAADTNHLTKLQQLLADGIANSVAANAVQAFNTIADSIGAAIAQTGSWSDVLVSVGLAFAQFTAGVLKDIAGILLKYEILLLLKSALGIGPGGAGGAHAGGVVGALTQSRSGLNPSLFIGAPRAHGGGMAGLAYGEVPVIVQAGEEIITAKDPRHRNNYNPNGGAGEQPNSIRNVLLFDPSEVAASMAGSPGEKVTMTHIRRNAPALRQLLGVK